MKQVSAGRIRSGVIVGWLIPVLVACGSELNTTSRSPAGSQPTVESPASQVESLGLNPEQLMDRYNSQATEDARIEDIGVSGSEFSARIDPTLRIFGTLTDNGEVASATVAYTGSTRLNDDPFYDLLSDGMEQLGAVMTFANFSSAVAVGATQDEANNILTELNYPAGQGAGSLEGIDNTAVVAGVAFRLHDAGLDGIWLEAEPAP